MELDGKHALEGSVVVVVGGMLVLDDVLVLVVWVVEVELLLDVELLVLELDDGGVVDVVVVVEVELLEEDEVGTVFPEVVGVVVETTTVVVVVVLAAQPLAVQASQQLEAAPTQTDPCFGAVHRARGFTAQLVLPPFVVRQQVTNPGFPQTDLAAQRMTAPLQLLGRFPAGTAF